MFKKLGILTVFLGFIGAVTLTKTSDAKIQWLPNYGESAMSSVRSTTKAPPKKKTENLQCSDYSDRNGNALRSTPLSGKKCKRFSHVVKGKVCYGECGCDTGKYPNVIGQDGCEYCASSSSCSEGGVTRCQYCVADACGLFEGVECHESLGCKTTYEAEGCAEECQECNTCEDLGYTATSCKSTDKIEYCPANNSKMKCTSDPDAEAAKQCTDAGYLTTTTSCSETYKKVECSHKSGYFKCVAKSCSELEGYSATPCTKYQNTVGTCESYYKCEDMNSVQKCAVDGFTSTGCSTDQVQTGQCSYNTAYYSCRSKTEAEKCVDTCTAGSYTTASKTCSATETLEKCSCNNAYTKCVTDDAAVQCIASCENGGYTQTEKTCTETQDLASCDCNSSYTKCVDNEQKICVANCKADGYTESSVNCTGTEKEVSCTCDGTVLKKCTAMTCEEQGYSLTECPEYTKVESTCDGYVKCVDKTCAEKGYNTTSCTGYTKLSTDTCVEGGTTYYKECVDMTPAEKCVTDGYALRTELTCSDTDTPSKNCPHSPADYAMCEFNAGKACASMGYAKQTCDATEGLVKDAECPHNAEFITCREMTPDEICVRDGWTLTECTGDQVVDQTCGSQYVTCRDKTCVEKGYTISMTECKGNKKPTGDVCNERVDNLFWVSYYKECVDKDASDCTTEGYTNRFGCDTRTQTSEECPYVSGYYKCTDKSCEDMGYTYTDDCTGNFCAMACDIGYTKEVCPSDSTKYKCVVGSCSGYTKTSCSCGTHQTKNSCKSGSTTYCKCECKAVTTSSCTYGYLTDSDGCTYCGSASECCDSGNCISTPAQLAKCPTTGCPTGTTSNVSSCPESMYVSKDSNGCYTCCEANMALSCKNGNQCECQTSTFYTGLPTASGTTTSGAKTETPSYNQDSQNTVDSARENLDNSNVNIGVF